MPSRQLDFPVFDADNHMYETPDALTKFLPEEYEGVIDYVEVNGRTKIAVKGQISEYIPNPTFDRVAAPGAQEEYFKVGNPEGKTVREILGRGIDALPAFREPAPRLELMDELGIDRALMWPTLASLLEERLRDDPGPSTSSSTPSTSGCTSTGPSTTRTASSPPRSSRCRSSRRRSRSSSGSLERGAKSHPRSARRRCPASRARGRSRCPSSTRSGSSSQEPDVVVGMHAVRQRLPALPQRVGGRPTTSSRRSPAGRASPRSSATAADRSSTPWPRPSATASAPASRASRSRRSRTAAAGSARCSRRWRTPTRSTRTCSTRTRWRCSSGTSSSTRSTRTTPSGSSS